MSDALRIDDFEERTNYTYADYLTWEGPERYQLINGKAYKRTSPSVAHQAILMELLLQFGNLLNGKNYHIFIAPLDVRLFPEKDNSDKTVLQPDFIIVCDKKKLSKNSVDGSPDLVIEVASKSNPHSQLFHKFHYYLKAAVREYWIVDYEIKQAQVYVYKNGYFKTASYKENDCIPVTILPDLEIALESLWARMNWT